MKIIHGDCRDVLKTLPECSIDSCVTDPPYGLSFMNKHWDYDVPGVDVWREVLRVLKPGAYLLSFFGTRTYHRGVVPIEDAGFEIRDQIGWAYGQGFPKSHNGEWGGTALKPAWEPIVMARKPFTGTVEQNYQKYGVGGLNIDGCRVGSGGQAQWSNPRGGIWSTDSESEGMLTAAAAAGRWPANLIHDGSDEVTTLFPESDGAQGNVKGTEPSSTGDENTVCYGKFECVPYDKRGDTGSAARFFYCAKASRKDRDEGLDDFVLTTTTDGRVKPIDNAYLRGETKRLNSHPTVKPTDLMRYLCRLVTPPGGKVLDPFMGSGSTGKAALKEGFQFVGIERDEKSFLTAKARVEWESLPAWLR